MAFKSTPLQEGRGLFWFLLLVTFITFYFHFLHITVCNTSWPSTCERTVCPTTLAFSTPSPMPASSCCHLCLFHKIKASTICILIYNDYCSLYFVHNVFQSWVNLVCCTVNVTVIHSIAESWSVGASPVPSGILLFSLFLAEHCSPSIHAVRFWSTLKVRSSVIDP